MKQSQRLIYIMIGIISLILLMTIVNLFFESEIILKILNDFQYLGIFISLLIFFVQQLSDQRAKNTEFFLELKNTFIMDAVFIDVYYELYKYYIDNNYDLSNLEQKHIVKYLAYFDSIALACENKIINIEEISKTFSYYFFLATNNPIIQKKELVVEGEFYPRLYELYKKLYEYNVNNNIEVIMENTALYKTKKYKKIIGEVNIIL